MTTKSPKVIAEGQLSDSKATLYTVPASTSAYVSKMVFLNTSATPQTVEVFLKPGATSRRIIYVTTLQQYETIIWSSGIVLETGDLIEGNSTTVNVVDYVIMGVTEA